MQEVIGQLRHAHGREGGGGHHERHEYQCVESALAWSAHERPATASRCRHNDDEVRPYDMRQRGAKPRSEHRSGHGYGV